MNKILYILVLLGLIACEKEVDMKVNDKPKKLVINCWLQPDSLIKAHVSVSRHILANNVNEVEGKARVLVYEDGIKIDSLEALNKFQNFGGDGTYQSRNRKPVQGKTYRIEVYSDSYGYAYVESKIPDTVAIEKLSFDTSFSSKYTYYDEYESDSIISNSFNIQAKISFSDPEKEENYYMVYVYKKNDTSMFFTPFEYINLTTSSPYVELLGNGNMLESFFAEDDDMVFNSSKNKTKQASVFAFSDSRFNGTQISIDIDFFYYTHYASKRANTNRSEVSFHVTSVSRDYFRYIRTVSIAGDINPFMEPVQVLSNVQNGYGVMITSNSNKRIVPF